MTDCTTRWCKSGLPGTVTVVENADDACFRLAICTKCAEDFGAKEGDDLMAEPIYSRTRKAERAATPPSSDGENG